MAMSAVLQNVGPNATGTNPVISSYPIPCSLTVYNTGTVPINMVSIQQYVLPLTASVVSNGTNSPTLIGANTTVPAAVGLTPGQQTYPLSFVIATPQIPGITSGIYALCVTCYSSDGSVFSAQTNVATTPALAGNSMIATGGQGGKGTAVFGYGELGYDLNFAPFIPGFV